MALGVAERGRNKLDAAQSAFEQALDVDPDDADALFNLAVLQMDWKKEPSATPARSLEEYLKAAPRRRTPTSACRSRRRRRLKRRRPAKPRRHGERQERRNLMRTSSPSLLIAAGDARRARAQKDRAQTQRRRRKASSPDGEVRQADQGRRATTSAASTSRGKLKTPQLLYFLNRMKSEFDPQHPTSARSCRS